MREFLFVAGCARSGTTALTRLLDTSPHIVLSIERYNRLSRPGEFSLSPSLFERERFFDVHEDDTHYDDLEQGNRHIFDHIVERFGTARFLGDKKPAYYLVYDELLGAFPDARVVFIYREPAAVASSYEVRRARGVKWRPRGDFRMAVDDWNESLTLTLQAMDRYPGQILPVDYDSVFMTDASLDPITRFLQLDDLDLPDTEPAATRSKAAELDQTREAFLTPEQVAWVKGRADDGLLAAIDARNPFSPVREDGDWTLPEARPGVRDLARTAGSATRRLVRRVVKGR